VGGFYGLLIVEASQERSRLCKSILLVISWWSARDLGEFIMNMRFFGVSSLENETVCITKLFLTARVFPRPKDFPVMGFGMQRS